MASLKSALDEALVHDMDGVLYINGNSVPVGRYIFFWDGTDWEVTITPGKMDMWVNVDEYLPTPSTFIICFDGRNVQEGFLREDGKWSRDDHQLISGVTHWMPMPNPPS